VNKTNVLTDATAQMLFEVSGPDYWLASAIAGTRQKLINSQPLDEEDVKLLQEALRNTLEKTTDLKKARLCQSLLAMDLVGAVTRDSNRELRARAT